MFDFDRLQSAADRILGTIATLRTQVERMVCPETWEVLPMRSINKKRLRSGVF
jgi:hypothetical protein